MGIDLSNLSPDDLVYLRQALGLPAGIDPTGRSPFAGQNRQLHDLRLLPTATDPRPTFFWSAETPRDDPGVTRQHEFPKLLWSPDGVEITVNSAREQAEKEAQGYLRTDPGMISPDPLADLRAQLAALSEDDRQAILVSQKRARLGHLEEDLADLSMDTVEALVAGHATLPTKRKPGRPRKVS